MVARRVFLALIITAFCFALMLFYDRTGDEVLPSRDVPVQPAFAAPSTSTKVYLPLILKNSLPTAPLWRFGIARVRRSFLDYVPADVAAMRFGWYLDYGVNSNAPRPYGMEYVPTVHVKQWKVDNNSNPTTASCPGCNYVTPFTYTVSPSLSQIPSIASGHPGMLWLVGNEIERRDWSGGSQDEIVPELYAKAYHEIYSAIKSADSSAPVAIGGMIQATPLRLEYLDRVWNGYFQTYSQTMPVDVWNIHGFVLQEKSCQYYTDCYGAEIPAGLSTAVGVTYNDPQYSYNKNFSIVAANINALRTWMKQHGQQNKPLIVSEYGVLYPDWVSLGTFTPVQVRDSFMYPSFNYFLNQTDVNLGYSADGYRLVQRWNWYSLDDDSGCYCNYGGIPYDQNFNGNLFYSGLGNNSQGLAPLGTYWKQYVQPLAPGSNPPYAP